LAWAAQRREEQAFPAEERRLYTADELDVVVDRRLQRHQATRVDAQRLSGAELQRVDHAASVGEAETVAFQLLHDEAFAAEQADTDLLLERDADGHTLRGTEERVLLADELSTQPREIHGQDAAGVRRSERDAVLAGRVVGEHRHEQAFTSQ